MRPKRFDCFPFAGTETELLLLECRLTELYHVMDAFVIVEADVDHQNRSKPLHYMENRERFHAWQDKIIYVAASGLPDTPHPKNPWAREHAQREWIGKGLAELDADDHDIVFQSDADEIPTILAARNVKPSGNELVPLKQRGHFWAIDWQYPDPPGWQGTVVGRVGGIKTLAQNRSCGPFAAMRDARNSRPGIPGGWHFSWLGGTREIWLAKVRSFCHPEVEDRIRENANKYFHSGIHVDGEVMIPVDVNHSWPKWMQDPNNVPAKWFRPRKEYQFLGAQVAMNRIKNATLPPTP